MRALRLRPLSLDGLPRLPRAAVAWTRAVARARAALPGQLDIQLHGLGALRARCTRLSFTTGPEVDPGASEAFAVEVHGQRGRLLVDSALALRLVTALLGAPAPTAVRALGRGERGVLAAVLVAALDAAAARGLRVGLDAPPEPEGDAVAIDLRVAVAGTEAVVRLELPPAALQGAPGPARIDPAALDGITVAVELGRTRLEAASFAGARAGDAVVFDGVSAAVADVDWAVEVRVGGAVLPGRLDHEGMVRRRAPLEIHECESEVDMSAEHRTETEKLAALSEEAARALAAAPVEIVAELGRLTVRGDELVGLIEGGVLSLGVRRPTQIQLRVGGRVWALGELVAIDDELGVRITRLVR
jgi:type III secretion system YscQ/HrcQ family protein